MATERIYKIVPRAVWMRAVAQGVFAGHGIDLDDGFIHLSSAEQVAETARKHFSGQTDLMLITVATDRLGETLRWEPSRDGALFPHVYGTIPLRAVTDAVELPWTDQGAHRFPDIF